MLLTALCAISLASVVRTGPSLHARRALACRVTMSDVPVPPAAPPAAPAAAAAGAVEKRTGAPTRRGTRGGVRNKASPARAGKPAAPRAEGERAPYKRPEPRLPAKLLEVGQLVEGSVRNLQTYGAFIELTGCGNGADRRPLTGLLHISQLSSSRVAVCEDVVSIGQPIRALVLSLDEKGQVRRTRLRAIARAAQAARARSHAQPDAVQ